VAACVEPGGLPGLPRVDTQGSTVSIVLGAGSSTSGYVAVRYAVDGNASEIRVPIPGGGGGSEICLASVGAPARSDCLVKVSIDQIPPIPPIPTAPPIPTVEPTVPPVDPICLRTPRICIDPNDPIGPIEPIDPWCNELYCLSDPPPTPTLRPLPTIRPIDPWCNELYCLADPPPIFEPICLTKYDICIP
jgi:hypothetical protein